jgi:hypothetical protein
VHAEHATAMNRSTARLVAIPLCLRAVEPAGSHEAPV